MNAQPSKYHVLLIGIDAYSHPDTPPLNGCVNDIDAIQRLLINNARIPPSQINRLVSPHSGAEHETTVSSSPATLANITAALEELGSERVGANDQVFVYFAGHGGRGAVDTGGRTFWYESLVAVDVDEGDPQLLYDNQLNHLIARIVARTQAVVVILDCCQSAGATRNLLKSRNKPRFADLERAFGRRKVADLPAAAGKRGTARGVSAGISEGVDQCQVVAACLSHELANEETEPGPDGIKHGLLTRSLMNALGNLSEQEFRQVPWGRIWHKMRAEVVTQEPAQHLWISGSLARAVLAGPPVDGDAGLALSRPSPEEYVIEAGTLAGVTVGAQVAVYGERPLKFPPLGSTEDLKSRASDVLLKVTSATRSTATAEADGVPFELPPGARGRLVQAGADEKLRCAVVPADPEVIEALGASRLLEVTSEHEATVHLERQSDGSWILTDDLYGAEEGEPRLFSLGPEQLVKTAPALLEQYRRYSLPFRMAERCTDLPDALHVRLLASEKWDEPPEEDDLAALPELPMQVDSTYKVSKGDTFCIRIHNASEEQLRVALLDSAGGGQVEWLGDQTIDPGASLVYWNNNSIGKPFKAGLEKGVNQSIDRLVVIGTTNLNTELKYLASKTTFAKAVAEATRTSRSVLGDDDDAEPELWTAKETILRIIG